MNATQGILLIHVNIPQIVAHFKNHTFHGILTLGMTGDGELHQKFIAIRANTVGYGCAAIDSEPGLALDRLSTPGTVEFQQERILKDFIPGVVLLTSGLLCEYFGGVLADILIQIQMVADFCSVSGIVQRVMSFVSLLFQEHQGSFEGILL